MGTYKNLRVWQMAMSFTTDIYKVTSHYPQTEKYGLADQMRRAAVSIASNIAEGYGRASNQELLHFLAFSLGSSNEIDTQILISKNLGFLSDEEFTFLDMQNENINKMLRSLISTRKNQKTTVDTE